MRRSAFARGVEFGSVQRTKTTGSLRRGVSAAALMFALANSGGAAWAQAAGAPPPAGLSSIDMNGVDLASGAFTLTTRDVYIGDPEAGGLTYEREFYGDVWRNKNLGTISKSGAEYTVSLADETVIFTLSGSVFTPKAADGASLSYNATALTYTYTDRYGVVSVFSKPLAETSPLLANEGKLTSTVEPSGIATTYTYKTVSVGGLNYNRLQSINNNLGYQLKFEYALASPATTAQLGDFRNLTKVTGLNNTVDYCAPSADSCSFSRVWPNATYAKPSTTTSTVTDTLGRVTQYSYDTYGRITGVKPPSAASNTLSVAYVNMSGGAVTSVTRGSSSWSYSFMPDGASLYAGVVDPLGRQRNITFTDGLFVIEYDASMQQVGPWYLYDLFGTRRLTRITEVEGAYTEFSYDARGNVTTVTNVPKTGSGLANIVTTASFDTSCLNIVTCNLPNSTTDAKGAVTNYAYDTVHGQTLTLTRPAPSIAAARPEIRYTYAPLYAWYKNSGGAIVQASTPVYRLTQFSTCISGTSCIGGSAEQRAMVIYGATGVANNLLPTVVTSASGDGALAASNTLTYDDLGDRLTVDGPLPGSADTTRYRYDAGRQVVGVIGPDPDGAGARRHSGVRATYNAYGQLQLIERVAVNSQSDADWAAATVLEQQASTYDAYGRLTDTKLVSGGVVQSLTQYSYNAVSQLECTAVRMNPAAFGSPPSACTLGVAGANGPDRITKITYNTRGQLTKETAGFGTTGTVDGAVITYNNWNQVATATDALGGLTTYEYDGFGRLKKARYPTAANRTISSTTDYEEYVYDAYGRVVQERNRDGQLFGLAYDQLDRLVSIDAPTGTADVTYAYDNRGWLTQAATATQTLTVGWDALGRQLSVTGPLGSISYGYDAASQRTRVTWPDAFYAAYDYDLAGNVTAVRENGATSGAGVLATFAYDDLGRRTSITRGNGVVTTYAYDGRSNLINFAHDMLGTANDQSYVTSYNADAQALQRAASNPLYAMTASAGGATAFTGNGLNQYSAVGGLTLGQDGRGNLTSDGVNTYGYDAANRLTSMSGVSISYDPLGRLYQTTGAATTRFSYDGADLIGEYNASGALLRRYVSGPGIDEPLVWYEGSGTADRRWLATDPQGSIVSVSDGAGASLAINAYDEYGAPKAGNVGRFSYTGQIWIPEVGLHYYKTRMYSPILGRFMQPDSIGYADGMNLYAYAGNDPINFSDPFGLSSSCGGQGEKPCRVSEVVVTALLISDFGGGSGMSGGSKGGASPFDFLDGATEVEKLIVVAEKKKLAQPSKAERSQFRAFLREYLPGDYTDQDLDQLEADAWKKTSLMEAWELAKMGKNARGQITQKQANAIRAILTRINTPVSRKALVSFNASLARGAAGQKGLRIVGK